MISPKISVVIPSFNKGKFIKATLESIVSQGYSNWELIIQDGGSGDLTVGVIEHFAKKYSDRIKWVSRKDNGQLDAINKGLSKATGDILTFINADDVYEKGAFEAVVASFTENPGMLWFAGKGIVINEKGKEIVKLVSWYKNFLLTHSTYNLLLTTNYLMQPSVFLSKKAYQEHGPFTGTSDFVMEYDLWLKLASVEMPVVVNKCLSRFRIEKNSKSKRFFKKLLIEDQRTIDKYTNNMFVLSLHKLHNLARLTMGKII